MSADDLLDANEVAAILRVPTGTVRSWASRGELACFRLGPKLTRFRRQDVEAFLEARRLVELGHLRAAEGAREPLVGRGELGGDVRAEAPATIDLGTPQ